MNRPRNDSGAAGLHPVGPARNADAAAKPHPHDHGSGDLRPHQLVERLRAALTPVQLAVAIAGCRVSGEYIAAVTAGLDLAWLRWYRSEELAQAGREIAASLPPGWTSQNLPHEELMRRRWPPTGDPQTWARYGPAGPPDARAVVA